MKNGFRTNYEIYKNGKTQKSYAPRQAPRIRRGGGSRSARICRKTAGREESRRHSKRTLLRYA